MHPIDPTDTRWRPLAEYTDRIPSSRRGKKLHRTTPWRWLRAGARRGVVLRTIRIGGCRYTCDAWVAEFIRACSAADALPTQHAKPDPKERERILREFGVSAAPNPPQGGSQAETRATP